MTLKFHIATICLYVVGPTDMQTTRQQRPTYLCLVKTADSEDKLPAILKICETEDTCED